MMEYRLIVGETYEFNFLGPSGRGKFLGFVSMGSGNPFWIVMDVEDRVKGASQVQCLNPAQMLSLTHVETAG